MKYNIKIVIMFFLKLIIINSWDTIEKTFHHKKVQLKNQGDSDGIVKNFKLFSKK